MTSLTINNQPIRYRIDPATPLLWALREASNLTGTKYGCGTGDCGACTVDIDGRAVMSCTVSLAQCEGAFVTTIEGLSRDRGHPVQQALVAEQAPQCGFCIPGLVMAASVLLKDNATPTDDEIDVAIANLCRCGIYPRLRRSIRRAGAAMRGGAPIVAAPPPGISARDAARRVPALTPAQD